MPDTPLAPAHADSVPRGRHLTVQQADDHVVIMCLSGILDGHSVPALTRDLKKQLQEAVHTGRRLVLDLTGLRLMSTAALRVLDTHTRHLEDEPVLIVAAVPMVREVFALAPLPGLCVHTTLDAALATVAALSVPGAAPEGPQFEGVAVAERTEILRSRQLRRQSARLRDRSIAFRRAQDEAKNEALQLQHASRQRTPGEGGSTAPS
ncbi:STAS domain-containing protein [Streptomyces silvensis]|uniref:STAS domain-containing protein n=1 Tax=Streptomyces silvensis TaxID=1765722 RepID=A0A0W7WX63_9ACTN|nr:STAS domain-containing protein [Streptomyces silvensis]KUF15170.1 hypothetical protein AT728_27375 [Streptomyces silvensis]